MKTALVCGGHGFIGHHLARRLKAEGYWVRTADIKDFPYGKLGVDDYRIADLRDARACSKIFRAPGGKGFDEVYQLAAWMGGAGVIFTGEHDAKIVHDSMLLNVNAAESAREIGTGTVFFSSSACVYAQMNQTTTDNPVTAEDSAYPAWPDSDYGFEKLMAERLYLAYARNHGMRVRIARFHNVFGIEGAWSNGREKAPAAMCRKVAQAPDGGEIEIWGDGLQTRSFLYIEECLEGIRRLVASDFQGPVNIGSDKMVSINQLAEMAMEIAGKKLTIRHVPGPLGVRGRTSDNRLIREKLGWAPDYPLRKGLEKTYGWIASQVALGREDYPWAN